MNKKGLEIAISTIVIIVISISVLIGLLLLSKNGFSSFNKGTGIILKSTSISSVREACSIACIAKDTFTFCCNNLTLEDSSVSCKDEILNVDCNIDCGSINC